MTQRKYKAIIACLGLLLVVLTCSSGEITFRESNSAVFDEKDFIQVEVHQLIVDPATQNPVVSLRDPSEERTLFIWIGPVEARAIHSVMQGIKHFRPLTHDLLASVIDAVNGKIHRIVITHAKENVFYATILMEKDGRFDEIDARPSDSIVMALKFEAPIFVSRELFERMSIALKDETRPEDEYGLELQELTTELAEYLSFAPRRGVIISGVRKGSQSDKDGLEAGDIIYDIEGQPIDSVMSFNNALRKNKTPVKAKIFRNSRFLTFTLNNP